MSYKMGILQGPLVLVLVVSHVLNVSAEDISSSATESTILTESATTDTTSIMEEFTGVTCENGGHYDGIDCVCKDIFYGTKCKFVRTELLTTVIIVKVEVSITINEQFNENLTNKDSQEYKNFKLRFEEKMLKFYKDNNKLRCKGIKINFIMSGSIIVNHDVLLEIDFNNAIAQQQEAAMNIEEVLNNTHCTSGEDDALCFKPNSTRAVPKEISLQDICAEFMPQEISQYFFAINVTTGIFCASNCSMENNYRIDCSHENCFVTENGPQCDNGTPTISTIEPPTTSILTMSTFASKQFTSILISTTNSPITAPGAESTTTKIIETTTQPSTISTMEPPTDIESTTTKITETTTQMSTISTMEPPTGTESTTSKITETTTQPSTINTMEPPTDTESTTTKITETTTQMSTISTMEPPTGTESTTSIITETTTQPSTISTMEATTCSSTVVPEVTCENGGYYDGIKCMCKNIFYGSKCEFVSSQFITNVIIVRVEVSVAINEIFKETLNDKNSKDYKDFALRFEMKMIKFYQDIMIKCKGIMINSVRAGSIVVNHDVLLETEFINATEQQREAAIFIEAALNNTSCTSGETDALCFKPNSATAVLKEIRLQDMCSEILPQQFSQYYFPINGTTNLICASNCSMQNNYTMYCDNGNCSVTENGPRCYNETTMEPPTISSIKPSATKQFTSNSIPVTVPEVICENGGHYDGRTCVCKKNFYGNKCEFVLNQFIINVIIVRVGVSVTLNEAFKETLNDKNSKDYKDFKLRFETKMLKFYQDKKLRNCKGVNITSVRPGSIIVDHDVLLEIDFLNAVEQQQEAAKNIEKALNNTDCTLEEDDALCFIPNSARAVPQEINLPDICFKAFPPSIQQYYFPVNQTTELICVTNCSAENTYNIDCNNGHCSVTDTGPQCFCEISDQYWYTGDRCQSAISKPGVIAGVTVGLAVLLIIILTLAFFLCRHRNCSNKFSSRSTYSRTL